MTHPSKQLALAWYTTLKDATHEKWDSISQKYLEYIHHNGYLKLLPEIERIMKKLEQDESGITAVIVKSAHRLQKRDVQKQVERCLKGTSVEISTMVEPSLIGGIRIETEDKRWDLSLKAQLHSLKKTINE